MNMRQKLCYALMVCSAIMTAGTASADDTGFTFTPYVGLKVDTIYDSANMRTGDFAVSVMPQPATGATNEFTMTANQTRFGIDVKGPSAFGAETTGKVEVDFFNSANAYYFRTTPEMTHAYVKLNWADQKMNLIVGQTWDVFASVMPLTLNFGQLYTAGNIGYRRPQIRLTKDFGSDTSYLRIEAAVTRAVENNLGNENLTESASNDSSGSPGYQGRLSYTMNLLGDKPTTIGIAGSMSHPRNYSGITAGGPTNAGSYYTANQWHGSLDLTMPFMHGLILTGKAYRGADMSGLFGLGLSSNTLQTQELEDGGWARLSYNINDDLRVSAGYGVAEILDRGQAVAINGATGVVKNSSVFGIIDYMVSQRTKVGLEIDQWTSTFANNSYALANRYQLSWMYDY